MERMVTRITEQVKCAFASFFFLMVFGMNSWSATVSDDEVKTWARQFSKNILDEQELKRLEEEWELVVSREHDDYFSEIYGVQWNDLSIKFYSDGKPMFFYKDFHDSFTTPTLELDVRPTESMKIVADRIVSYSAGKEYEFIGSTLQDSGIHGMQGSLGSKRLLLQYSKRIAGRYSLAHSVLLAIDATNGKPFSFRWLRCLTEKFQPEKINAVAAISAGRAQVEREAKENGLQGYSSMSELTALGAVPFLQEKQEWENSELVVDRGELVPVWFCLYTFRRSERIWVELITVDGYSGNAETSVTRPLEKGESPLDCIKRTWIFIPTEEMRMD